MPARPTHAFRHALVALLALGLALGGAAGCGAGQSTPDSKIVRALDLKQTGRAYEVGGDPFCTIVQLLNDADEVEQASMKENQNFVIASPNGEVGVLARRPFPLDCSRRVKDDLKRLAGKSD
jgi:hypothetical protein